MELDALMFPSVVLTVEQGIKQRPLPSVTPLLAMCALVLVCALSVQQVRSEH